MTQSCRRASVPACETFTDFISGARPPLNTVMLTVRVGDILDVGILWTAWLEANGGRLKSSTWAASGSPDASPQSPTLTGPVFNETGETAVLIDASAAAVGDTYHLDNTVVVARDPNLTGLVLADRTLIRRIHVKVAAG